VEFSGIPGLGRYGKPSVTIGSILAVLALLLSIIFVNAYPWDTTAYHLPFTARQFHIKDLSGITELLPSRYEGFPKFWRIALYPGLILRAPRLFLICNFLSIGILCIVSKKLLRLPWWLTCCAVLCFPISLEGFRSSYQDFSTNAFIAAGALFTACSDSGNAITNHHWKRINLGLLMLALAANIKTQGLLMAIAVLASCVLWTLVQKRRNQASCDGEDSVCVAHKAHISIFSWLITYSLLVIIFVQPIANIFSHSNPFYPVRVFGLQGTETAYSTTIQYIPNLPIARNLLGFYSSALEIDPIVRSERGWSFERSIGAFNRVNKKFYRSGGAGLSDIRTGGSNGFLFLILSIIAFWPLCGILSGNAQLMLDMPRAKLMTSVILIAFLPQSMELRYYLSALFIACLLALTSANKFFSKLSLIMVFLAMSFSIISVFQGKTVLAEIVGQRAIGPTILNAINVDKTQLISAERCYEMGTLKSNLHGANRALILDKTKVENNIPFQCRMVIEKNTFIDYSDTSNRRQIPWSQFTDPWP